MVILLTVNCDADVSIFPVSRSANFPVGTFVYSGRSGFEANLSVPKARTRRVGVCCRAAYAYGLRTTHYAHSSTQVLSKMSGHGHESRSLSADVASTALADERRGKVR
eukprot:scaffold2497_cov119-Isochrysis_galbana.AAC.10